MDEVTLHYGAQIVDLLIYRDLADRCDSSARCPLVATYAHLGMNSVGVNRNGKLT